MKALAHLLAFLFAVALLIGGGYVLYSNAHGVPMRVLVFAGACAVLAVAVVAPARLSAAAGGLAPLVDLVRKLRGAP